MKTLILSDYSLISEYIKDALAELQLHTIDNYAWFKGRFYSEELYLIENHELKDLSSLLDVLIAEGPIKNVISIGLGSSLVPQLKDGDILINDYPRDSCQDLMDRFLNATGNEDGEEPLRIFAGNILDEMTPTESSSGLICADPHAGELFSAIRSKGLPTLAIRIIKSENHEDSYDMEVANNIIAKFLSLLKRSLGR